MNALEKECSIRLLKYNYLKAKKKEKGELLNQTCEIFSCHRKHAIRLLSKKVAGRPKNPCKRGRKSKYGGESFKKRLLLCWRTTGYVCSKILHTTLKEWVPYIEDKHGKFEDEVKELLKQVSPSTIDRILKGLKCVKGKCTTKPGSMIREQIPIHGNIWDTSKPGFFEADTVARCGGSLAGEFVYSLTLTDIARCWTEIRCLWGKGAQGVLDQIQDIETVIPFNLLGFDSDCGSEFINYHLLHYFTEHKNKVVFTRSRAYHKNDNAHVEQKNDSVARRYLGYKRLDYIEVVPLVNAYLKEIISPLVNHFMPCFKLKEKILLKAKVRRKYEAPITPYQRVIQSELVHDHVKEKLELIHNSLNPVELMDKKEIMLRLIFNTVDAHNGLKINTKQR